MRDSRRATLSQFGTRTWYRTASLRSVQIVLYNESRQTMPSVLGENALISFLFDSFPLFLTGNASFHSNSDKLSYPPPPPPNPIFKNSLHWQLRWSGNARLHSQSSKLPHPPPQPGIWKLSIPATYINLMMHIPDGRLVIVGAQRVQERSSRSRVRITL